MPIIKASYLKSKKLYALNPSTFRIKAREFTDSNGNTQTGWNYTVEAVWYAKRNNGRRAAFFGTLTEYNTSIPNSKGLNHAWNYEEFILNYKSSRYGGNPYGCFDGQGAWWGNEEYRDDINKQLEILPFLKTQLENEPLIPEGYEGWFLLTE